MIKIELKGFDESGPDPYLPNINELHDAWPAGNSIDPTGDLWNTSGADATIIGSLFSTTPPAIITPANDFYNLISATFPDVPIIETGQSLGGAIADAVVADHLSAVDSTPQLLTADTFNALPYSYSFTDLNSMQQAQVNAAVTNYYVGNEVLTQSIITDSWLFSSPIGGTEPIINVSDASAT